MAVYVDDMHTISLGNYKGMKMSHMIADTSQELLNMVIKIGVNPKWIQDKDTYSEHFDICLTKRKKAVEAGAIEIGIRDYARMVNTRKVAHLLYLPIIIN